MKHFFHLLIFITSAGYSQQAYRGISTAVTVSGKSSKGDWALSSKEGSVAAEMALDKKWKPCTFRKVSFSLPARSLQSESATVKSNALYSLDSKKNSTITFFAEVCTVSEGVVSCPGRLTIAGKTLPSTLTAGVRLLGPLVEITGTQIIRLSDFLGKTPSYFFKTIASNDEVEISFDTVMKVSQKEESRRK